MSLAIGSWLSSSSSPTASAECVDRCHYKPLNCFSKVLVSLIGGMIDILVSLVHSVAGKSDQQLAAIFCRNFLTKFDATLLLSRADKAQSFQ